MFSIIDFRGGEESSIGKGELLQSLLVLVRDVGRPRCML